MDCVERRRFVYKKSSLFRSRRGLLRRGEHAKPCGAWPALVKIVSSARSGPSKPTNPVFFVCLDHARRWVVVGIRGTVATRDLLADVTASQVKFRNGRAHLGFLRCAAFVEKAAAEALRKLTRTMRTTL